jgi:hypothetical protein
LAHRELTKIQVSSLQSRVENLNGLDPRETFRLQPAEIFERGNAIIANDARKLSRFIYPIGELRREALLEILPSPRHLGKVAEKEKRHAAIVASLPFFDPESD